MSQIAEAKLRIIVEASKLRHEIRAAFEGLNLEPTRITTGTSLYRRLLFRPMRLAWEILAVMPYLFSSSIAGLRWRLPFWDPWRRTSMDRKRLFWWPPEGLHQDVRVES